VTALRCTRRVRITDPSQGDTIRGEFAASSQRSGQFMPSPDPRNGELAKAPDVEHVVDQKLHIICGAVYMMSSSSI
jgi:hypothetical protein